MAVSAGVPHSSFSVSGLVCVLSPFGFVGPIITRLVGLWFHSGRDRQRALHETVLHCWHGPQFLKKGIRKHA